MTTCVGFPGDVMKENLLCYRCGATLDNLPLPLSRRDECPGCTAHVHVCRMCRYFDTTVPKQCLEDDAEEVKEKDRVNFCEWFKPSPNAFDPRRASQEAAARSKLSALFGESEELPENEDDMTKKARDLFR